MPPQTESCKTSKQPKANNASHKHQTDVHQRRKRAPTENPPFTLSQLKAAIPAHCFKRSYFWSFFYLFMDVTFAAILMYVAQYIDHPVVPTFLKFILWPAYYVAQGSVLTGIWVVAHECGHRAFADSKLVCDIVGLICHSMLLVPYHSWRISHGTHHKGTGSMEKDEVFVPSRKSALSPAEKDPGLAIILLELLIMATIGWPAYLLGYTNGGFKNSHYHPDSNLFNSRQKGMIILSDIGLLVWISVLFYITSIVGVYAVAQFYFMPYLVVNFLLVLYTKLHHTDTKLPHYSGKEWYWLKGALCTIDRDYGLLNFFNHEIGSTHIAHHLFSKMPHYHCKEATEHLKKVLGPYYTYDDTPIYKVLFNVLKECRYVDDAGSVLFYKKGL